ncbi:MAG: VCBS repeat-containing protein [Bryobacteraceae bacterium]
MLAFTKTHHVSVLLLLTCALASVESAQGTSTPCDFNVDNVPDLVWQNDSTRQVTVNYYGGANKTSVIDWAWLHASNNPGWRAVAVADFNGDGVPDLVWQNDATRQVTVNYYGGPGGASLVGWNWLNTSNNSGWRVVAAADFNRDGVPDLVWQNDTTRQVTVNYYGGSGGASFTGWAWLNTSNNPDWHVVAVADFNSDGVPDLIWQNDTTRQVTVNYYGGSGGSSLIGWNWLNTSNNAGWHVAGATYLNGDNIPDLVWQNDSTRTVTVNYYGGAAGTSVTGWDWLNTGNNTGWTVVNMSAVRGSSTPPFLLGPPTLVSPANAATNIGLPVAFNWTALEGADGGYQIVVSTTPTGMPGDPRPGNCSGCVVNTTVANPSYTATGLIGNTTYYWQVRGISSALPSMWSAKYSFTTAELPAPTLETPTVSGGTIYLTWTYPWSGVVTTNDGYRLEESKTSATSGFVEISQITSRDSPYKDTLPRALGTYYYRVRVYTRGVFSP